MLLLMASMWTCIQCPQTSVLPVCIDGPKWRNGNPPSGTDLPLDIIQTELLGCSRVRSCGESHPFTAPLSLLAPFQGSWSDPGITALKWDCLQVVVALTSSPFMIIPITLSIILDPHHDWYLLRIGHGQEVQQQDILIVALYTWDL